MHGDTVYIKVPRISYMSCIFVICCMCCCLMFRQKLLQVMTGRYVGELDGTTKLEWVKARYFTTMVVVV